MKRFGITIVGAWVILALGPVIAEAGLAVDFTNSTGDSTNDNWSLGWAFTVNQPFTVRELGFYDDLKNGLTESHDVGIYDALQNLVVSGVVVPGDPLVSWWRWTTVTPTVLNPTMEYRIAAVTGSENYTWDPESFTVDPAVNYLSDAYHDRAGGVLVYPETSETGVVAWFGPNFSGEPVVVPVPASLLLVVPGLMTLIGARKRLS